MTFVRRTIIDRLFKDMVKNHDLAVKANDDANAVTQAYYAQFASGHSRFTTRGDAKQTASADVRFLTAVSDNQMYDRFATRDAAVLSAVLKMVEMDLLTVKEE
jgi:hypothetical protein